MVLPSEQADLPLQSAGVASVLPSVQEDLPLHSDGVASVLPSVQDLAHSPSAWVLFSAQQA